MNHPISRAVLTVLAPLVPLSTSHAAELMTVIDAERSIIAWSSVHDWKLSDDDFDSASTSSPSAPLVAALQTSVIGYAGEPIADGNASIESSIACDAIAIQMSAAGETFGAEVVQSDGGGEGTATVSFELIRPAEITFTAAAAGDGGYVWGYVTLRDDQPGPALTGASFQEDDVDSAALTQVLAPGVYTLTMYLQAWAFSDYGETAIAAGSVEATLHAFELSDLDRNHAVDVDDLVITLLDWGCADDDGSCPGDADRNGVVDVDDLLGILLAWGGCG